MTHNLTHYGVMTTRTERVKATELGIAGLSRHGVLADGALILRTSHQLKWFYAKVVKGGRITTRRYRHDQMVEVEAA